MGFSQYLEVARVLLETAAIPGIWFVARLARDVSWIRESVKEVKAELALIRNSNAHHMMGD